MSWRKYPRTPHFSFSPGATSDDKILRDLSAFEGVDVVVSEKRDGECTSLYTNYFHARSIDSKNHPSRNWLRAFHAQFAYKIPEGWRICGENLYARHSIAYDDLTSYFEGFSVWDDRNVSLAWAATEHIFVDLGITPVPVLWRGKFNLQRIKDTIAELDFKRQEGIVVRVAGEIPYDQFGLKVVKYVRVDHVQTDDHWMHGEIVPNRLKLTSGGAD